MKILLIDPPYDRLQNSKISANYPLGLAYLVSSLNKNGHEAVYLNLDWDPQLPSINPFSRRGIISRYKQYLKELNPDSNHPVWPDFKKVIRDFKPRLVGISTCSVKMKSVLRLVEIIKETNSGIFTVLGGHHSQIFAKDILENVKDVDFIILGEGEITLLELANVLKNSSRVQLGMIDGLVYRDNKHNVIFNKPRALLDNLDKLPQPSPCYYYARGRFISLPALAIMASRGCPYNCNYCATNNIWQRKVRWRSPRNVVDEIKLIIANQKERFLSFYDDCFTLDKKWLLEFCDIMIKEGVKINWQCITSVNLLDEIVFRKIIQAGCIKIHIAIESGSERILRFANKNVNLDVVRKTFNLAKKYKISETAYIMIGFPTETEYDIRLTQKIITETRPDWVYCSVLIPLPGTMFYDWSVEHNLIDTANAWRSDTIENIIMNFTNTMSDEEFFRLVDETFLLCYRINSNIINLFKRVPIRQYLTNPLLAFFDIKRSMQYTKR